MNLKTLALIGSLAFLTACATTDNLEPSPGVYENPAGDALICKIPLQLEPIEPIQWRDFEWQVLNTERVQRMIDSGEDIQLYALSQEDFKNQSLTAQDILRYLATQREQLNLTIDYYSIDVDAQDDDSDNIE